MFQQILNWRTLLAFIAILIVSGTIVYSQYLAGKIAKEEKKKVEQWVEASKSLADPNITDVRLSSKIMFENTDIPIIETNEKDSITGYVNIDSLKAATDKDYLPARLKKLRSINEPIIWTDPGDSTKINKYYYGHTALLNEVRYYPLVQLVIVGLFILVTLMALRGSYRSVQNQVWAGMAKETAHQLGTPVSSLEGWIEMLKEKSGNEKIVPQLEKIDLVSQINTMIDYMRKRATGKINFSINTHGRKQVIARVSAPLFDWVIENLLKNSLDALEGRGAIIVDIQEETKTVH